MNSKIKFVYSDIGGVLFDEGGTARLCEEYSIDFLSYKNARGKYLRNALKGKITADEMHALVLKDLGIENKIENYNDYWCSHSNPYTKSHEMLEKISQHYPLGLLTNIVKEALPYYKKYGLYPDLEYKAIIESAEIGLAKPEKEIYGFAQSAVGVMGPEILFIDDLKVNIEAAKIFGWKTIWFDRENQERSISEVYKYLLL